MEIYLFRATTERGIHHVIAATLAEAEGSLALHGLRAEVLERIGIALTSVTFAPLVSRPEKRLTPGQRIVAVTAAYYDLSVKDLRGRSRRRRLVKARNVAAFLLREDEHTYPEIADLLGWAHHTSAMSAVDHVHQLKEQDLILRHDLETIRQRLAS